ncbi:MAG: hypothetical protein O2800_04025 [Planctomycetota bacterium]|nr:hypothetical protein [Planctomycetota bacterium]
MYLLVAQILLVSLIASSAVSRPSHTRPSSGESICAVMGFLHSTESGSHFHAGMSLTARVVVMVPRSPSVERAELSRFSQLVRAGYLVTPPPTV